MLFIILSVIQSVLILVTFKMFDRYRIDNLQAIVVNYIVAGTIGFTVSSQRPSPGLLIHYDWFSVALFLGILFISTFFVFALSSQIAGIAITSVSSKISLIVPVIASIFLFGELLNWQRSTGILLALASFYLIFTGREKISWKAGYTWLPVLVFFGNGLVDTTMKYADHHYIKDDLVLFLAVVFTTSFVIGLAIFIIRLFNGKERFQWKSIAGGAFLGMINFGSTYYMLKAISVYEGAVVFPVTNASIVGISVLIGFFAFREKLNWINWTGIICAVFSIIIIANA